MHASAPHHDEAKPIKEITTGSAKPVKTKSKCIDGTHNISHGIAGFHDHMDLSPSKASIHTNSSGGSSPSSPQQRLGSPSSPVHSRQRNRRSKGKGHKPGEHSSGYSSDENSVGSTANTIQSSNISTQNSTQSALLASRPRHQLTAEDISITNRVLRGKVDEIPVPGEHSHSESVQSSHAAGGETAHHRARMMWKTAFQKFEKFRITKGHSLNSIFNVLNPRNYDAVTLRYFASSLSEYCPMLSFREAYSIACACDINGKNEVSMKDLLHLQSVVGASLSIGTLLENHPVFPDWLSNRDDFQHQFAEWDETKGLPSMQAMEQALDQKPDNRTSAELQTILRWMKYYRTLPSINNRTLLELCSKVNAMHVPAGRTVFKEHDSGDAFYACVRGSLKVQIAGQTVKVIEPGNYFGEFALERNVPRSATVIATTDCFLIHLLASEYMKLLAANSGSQHTSNRASNLVVEFISSSVTALRSLEIKTITQLVQGSKCVSYYEGDQIVLQGEPCSCLCIVLKGKVRIMRKLNLESVWMNAAVITKPDAFQIGPNLKGQLSLSASTLDAGRIFGDDFVYLHRHRYSYSVMAISPKVDVLFCPKAIAMECLDGPSIEQLKRANVELYENEMDLILRREQLIRSKLVDGRQKPSSNQQQQRIGLMEKTSTSRGMGGVQLQPLSDVSSSTGAPTKSIRNGNPKLSSMHLAPLIGGNVSATVLTASNSQNGSSQSSTGSARDEPPLSPMTASPPDSPNAASTQRTPGGTSRRTPSQTTERVTASSGGGSGESGRISARLLDQTAVESSRNKGKKAAALSGKF